ncbi:MAG: GNAT family N-acetyltransferase [Gemmatimonadota bacterium]|nr:MAG: GNAT family N-acetyltransferase [Gemmatimonadota bacterium]
MTQQLRAHGLEGPRRPTKADVSAMNRLFSDSFTERYRRDGLIGVRVPQLNPAIWRYAIRDAGNGAMLWFDEKGELVAFNMAHHSGVEGWMGPLAVRTDRQGLGIGKVIVTTAIAWLLEEGVTTLGLETMPRTVENIGFYGQLGFVPQYLTMTMTCDVGNRAAGVRFERLSDLDTERRSSLILGCRRCLDDVAAGYDFTREFELSVDLGIGDAAVIGDDGEVTAFALWHSAPLTRNRPNDELRILKLFATSAEAFEAMMSTVEQCASESGLPRVAVRCQTAYEECYRILTALGYRVRWTDLRMTLTGFPEAVVPGTAVLLSNWEI